MSETKEAAAILRRAAERISKPGAWMQGELAADASGTPLRNVGNPDDDPTVSALRNAACWCAEGALQAEGARVLDEAWRALAKQATGDRVGAICEWNDEPGRTAEEVASAMIAAAEELEKSDG